MSDETVSPPSATDRFVERFTASLSDGSFIRLVLSSATPAAAPRVRIMGRLVEVRGEPVLSLTEREARRDVTRNLPLADTPEWLRGQLGTLFQAALLGTRSRDWQLTVSPDRPARLVAHPPASRETPSRAHDRPKASPLDDETSRDWMSALGLVDASGKIPAGRADKHRQVRRYTEILGHLVQDAGWPAGSPIRVADMGCGRGYLTFATWHLLRRKLGFAAAVHGIETREDLVREAEQTARRLGLDQLAFTAGTIAETPLESLDVLIALHACNTATDDALRRGIEGGCRLLVVAPCCHQEVRPQLGRPEPLGPVLRHGIMAERLAEWVTDGLRALVLEWAGYRVKLVEFVASEHTPKNLLLAAVRTGEPFTDPDLRQRALAFRDYFGIEHHALDPLLALPGSGTSPS